MTELPIEQAWQLAVQKHKSGKLDEAEAIYRNLILRNPGIAEIHLHLGLVLLYSGRSEEAAVAFGNAIAMKQDYAVAYGFLGSALRAQRRLNEAFEACTRAVQIKSDYAEGYFELGNVLSDLGRMEESVVALQRAVELNPDLAGAHANLGDAFRRLGRLNEALAACNRAVQLEPDSAYAHNNLGVLLRERKQLDQAIAAHRRGIELNPNDAISHTNLGSVLCKKNEIESAIAHFRRAISIDPDFADAHWNLSHALLLQGDYAQGLPEYEWRSKVIAPSFDQSLSQPRWDGGHLNGRTIFLQSEQGYGDVIQFVRYAPLVGARGGRVIVECRNELTRLLESSALSAPIFTAGGRLPDFDCRCPMASLPLAFKTDLNSIPATIPYIKPEPGLLSKWKDRLAGAPAGKKVGLVWAGGRDHYDDANRSMPLEQLTALVAVESVGFYSLQKGHAGKQNPPNGLAWTDWTDELIDFAETAALLANLHLLIAVDTATAHLAGAMGMPVWLLLPYSPDWRWMLNRTDSPWYPTMSLIRQPASGDWASVMNEVVARLNGGNSPL